MNVSISILIPVYSKYGHLNEELKALSGHLEGKGLKFEILLLDNTGNSSFNDVVKEQEHIRIVETATGASQQRAYIDGFRVSSADWALLLDHDLMERRELIDIMISNVDDNYDVIRAIRKNRRYQNCMRFLGSKMANAAINLFSKNKIRDVGSSLSLYKKAHYKSALDKKYERFHNFPLFILTIEPAKIKEVFIDASRENTDSEYDLMKLAFIFLKLIRLKIIAMAFHG